MPKVFFTCAARNKSFLYAAQNGERKRGRQGQSKGDRDKERECVR